MDFKSLIEKFAKNNGLSPLKEKKGCYTLLLEGNTVRCYSQNKKVWLESSLGSIPSEKENNDCVYQFLLTRSMGFIRDRRACLSIDTDTCQLCLHQRIYNTSLSIQDFQIAIENFGGCLSYLKELINQFKGAKPPH